jgi:hypothetical protein
MDLLFGGMQCHELESDAIRRQRNFMQGWMRNAVEIATEVATAIEDDRVE